MTPERKRTLLLMIATLVTGILIGVFSMSIVNKKILRQPSSWGKDGKEAIVQKILAVIEADSAQSKQIRPHILETIARIETLRRETAGVVDSLETKLKPFISEKQMEQLREFHKKVRDRMGN